MKTILMTESAFDQKVYESILGKSEDTGILIDFRRSKTSSISAARTILSTTEHLLLLVVDADQDTDNSLVRTLVGQDSDRFKLILIDPEIEALFFTEKSALEAALNQEIPEMIWDIGKTAPKSTLDVLLKQSKGKDKESLLASEVLLTAMRQHPKIQEILEFAQMAHA